MKTSPAFQLYVSDFMLGTAHMDAAEVGAYIRLLCHQWEQGHLPDDKARLCRLAGCDETILPVVLEKFQKCENGGLKNAKLEQIRAENQAFKERQKANGKKGGRPRTSSSKGSKPRPFENETQTKATPNPNKSSSSSSSSSNSSPTARKAPSLAKVKAAAANLGIPPEVAETFFHDCEARPIAPSGMWTTKQGQEMGKWQHALQAYAQRWQSNEAKDQARLEHRRSAMNGPKPKEVLAKVGPSTAGGPPSIEQIECWIQANGFLARDGGKLDPKVFQTETKAAYWSEIRKTPPQKTKA